MSIPENKYCHNCGVKIPTISKFCNHCGTSQASLREKPPVFEEEKPQAPHRIKPRPQNTFTPMARGENDDDDDDYIDHIDHIDVNIDKLDVDFVKPNLIIKETFASVMQQGAALPPNTEQFIRPAPPSINSSDVIKQFQQEAGTLRPK